MLGFYIIICCLFSYLLGSIPSAIWVGKKFYQVDVREHGSKNAGATNTFRVLGKRAGIPVLIMDIAKGILAVQLIYLLPIDFENADRVILLKILFGICALVGHLFPVFANFKGGKGVATLAGVIAAIHPLAWVITTSFFIFMLIISRYVSLSSISAAIVFPILVIFILKDYSVILDGFALAIAALIIFTHRKNIKRLLNHEESRITFSSKS